MTKNNIQAGLLIGLCFVSRAVRALPEVPGSSVGMRGGADMGKLTHAFKPLSEVPLGRHT